MGIGTLRRHYANQAEKAEEVAVEGTPLPDDFPAKAKLEAQGYRTLESLRGATPESLRQLGLTRREAQAVLDALGG